MPQLNRHHLEVGYCIKMTLRHIMHIFKLEACTGMGIAGIPRNSRESRGDGNICRGIPRDGTKLCGIPAGVQLYLTLVGHMQQKICFQTVK